MPKTVTLSAVGNSETIRIAPSFVFSPVFAGVGLLVTFTSGASATATVQISGDGTYWNDHDALNGLTASANGNVSFPVNFVRLNVSVYGSGTVVLNVCTPSGD